jgi:hypothetical protein
MIADLEDLILRMSVTRAPRCRIGKKKQYRIDNLVATILINRTTTRLAIQAYSL